MPHKDPEKAKAYHKDWYKNRGGKVKQIANAVESYRRKQQWLDDQKKKPCADCGEIFPPECMDHDHVRGKKLFGIGGSLNNRGWESIKQEIAKL